MAIKYKNVFIYVIYFLIILIGLNFINSYLFPNVNNVNNINNVNNVNKNINSLENPTVLVETPIDSVNYPVYPSYILDSYEPRYIAPRYYDTQFLIYQQPGYTRTFGHYPLRHRDRVHPPGYGGRRMGGEGRRGGGGHRR